MYYLKHYVVDWDKVKTFEDLKQIMSEIELAFEPDHPAVPKLKQFLLLQDKPPIMRAPL